MTKSHATLRTRIENALLMVMAGWLWLADRIYKPVIDLLGGESLDGETICLLLDLQGDEGWC